MNKRKKDQVKFFLLGIYLILAGAGLLYCLYCFWPKSTDGSGPGDLNMILIVMTCGAIGSYVHATTSFVTFFGNRSLISSWIWWYILRPFIGMGLALIFYFFIRGGLLSVNANSGDISIYGIAAVAALAGMFSKQATDKLREVFDNLFKTEKGKGDDMRLDKVDEQTQLTKKMIPLSKMTYLKLEEGQNDSDIKITDIHNLLGRHVTRIPVLNHDWTIRFVIHQSVLYQFIANTTLSETADEAKNKINDATLEDLVNSSKEIGDLLQNSIEVLAETDTIGIARQKMEENKSCQDIFVTKNGEKEEPVLGWLMNVDIIKEA